MSEKIKGMLSLQITDIEELEKSYMPFLENGGIFIPTESFYNIGDTILVSLNLLDDVEPVSILGTIVWITPKSCHEHSPGVGVSFNKDNLKLRNKIESHLVDSNNSHPSYTI
jgi:type IV pilus assembly protein PilZ